MSIEFGDINLIRFSFMFRFGLVDKIKTAKSSHKITQIHPNQIWICIVLVWF